LSKKFNKTLEEKYGLSGKKGEAGETFFKEFYEAKGYIVTHYDDDAVYQIKGIDFVLDTGDNLYTVDVKNNLTTSRTIYVECQSKGWLFNPKKKSEFISHVNPEMGLVVSYRRTTMKNFLKKQFHDYQEEVICLPISMLPFVKIEGTKI
jgi:hypothetical protein